MSGDGRKRERWDNRNPRKNKQKKQQHLRTAEEELEAKYGFDVFSEGESARLGWLLTFASSSCSDSETGKEYSCVDLYFVSQDGKSFKTKYRFRPYFYLATKEKVEIDVESHLRRRFEGLIAEIEIIEKEDLDLKNHLSGLQRPYLRISFDTVQQLMNVKNDLLHVVERNRAKMEAAEAYESIITLKREQKPQDFLDFIIDLREYDVPYHVRFAIDNDVRCGQWYDISASISGVVLERRTDLLQRAEVRVCAFDIETTKLPLKFPDAEYDNIMMISYMVDGKGFLIINRECVGDDIENLEYTPKPEFEGVFEVMNVKNEAELLSRWFTHMQELKPGIFVSYNGDYFDWPFLETRAAYHGLKMISEIGFQCDKNQGECRSKFACHLDCFAWVKRDSYLPQGSQGLKAVTKAKLGYDPLEVNPEDMVRFAKERPQMMASYSVSDAVATYYLYMTYVHPFIFSLATIIPMSPDEVLRKGSGTLCEMLLMVQAYKANVICPNKHQMEPEKFYSNHLLESETYIGGHVECLESGVFRSDLPTHFKLDPLAYQVKASVRTQISEVEDFGSFLHIGDGLSAMKASSILGIRQLVNNLDRDLQYAIKVEGKMDLESVCNYEEVKNVIEQKLMRLRDSPTREECPLIYHLDVAAMYPNIILTNRLQPPSTVTDETCTACDFNRPGKTCLRKLEWVWRGEIFMAKKSDYYHMKKQIESEIIDAVDGQSSRSFLDLPKNEQQTRLKDRLKKYCQKAYKRVLDKPVTELREAGICMRENPFYVDTVRSFRDRRYEYKGLNKVWKGKLSEAKASGNSMKIQEAQDMVVLYDSLQLAHKCILNSFYGYVMRKGARWYSMEMAGVVTYTGAKIIQNARLLVEKIGKPLELDTDGIWCVLPGSFPENFTFKTKDAKKNLTISYPCVMLNVDVARNNTNDQYQTLVDPINKTYATHSECSIEFEVDGPYKAMILPASKEEGILIKKRYAVFNDDGTLAELKGFEIKRRGELKLIKVFQAELFDKFLHGSTLEECYSAVASVADRWLDLLDNQGKDIADDELLDYISESSTMSKSLIDYGEQKSCAVTTARRLADFLGETMVKDKGLRCQYIIACEPQGTPVSQRAVPVAIFETDSEIMKHYIRKWCKISSDVGIRSIIDWLYYRQRLSSAVQKIITIPAAMQKVANPVPRVVHPDWLHKKVREKEEKFRQRKLVDIFRMFKKDNELRNDGPEMVSEQVIDKGVIEDLEDFHNKGRNLVDRPKPIVCHYEENSEQHKARHPSKENDGTSGILTHDNRCQSVSIMQKDIQIEIVDRNVDYEGWLEMKKRKWRDVCERRKRQRLGGVNGVSKQVTSSINHKGGKGRQGVTSYFKSHESALARFHWQIIQLVPSPTRGEFFAWVLIDGSMLKIPIVVPRIFYLNSKAAVTEEFPGRRVNKTLPHGKSSHNLIEVVISEDQYQAEVRKLAALISDPEIEHGPYRSVFGNGILFQSSEDNFLFLIYDCLFKVDQTSRSRCKKALEGIYEANVPLEFGAILQIGCVCKVDKTAKKRHASDSWSLTELHMKTTAECSYLEQSISFFYLYHSISEGRAIYVGYFPVGSTISVVVVNPYQNKDVTSMYLERQFREACQALGVEQTLHDGITFNLDYVGHFKDAEKMVQKAINQYRHDHPGSTVAILQCPNIQSMKLGIRVLEDFPCLSIPSHARDSQYQVLGWQQVAAKIGMQRSAASLQWLNERISLARYAHVPLGNFELDWLVFTADVFFSRALHDQQQVLWISDNGIPDLGGISEEDSCFVDEVHQMVLIYPGAYRKVSVELKIHHLAVNALLKSNHVDEMEGGALLGFDQDISMGTQIPNQQYSFDDTTSCASAFRTLKQLIQRCLTDAVTSGNVYADAILQHLYRWLCSPQSKLHDPALHRMLHKVMQKVFALLLAELRKLGASIIFANFSKVIIDTGKYDISAAKAYSDSLVKTIQSRDLFEWIELEPVQFWHSLLYMDQHNYGGIPVGTDEHAEGHQVDIVSSWNVAEYLPKKIQDHFIFIVSQFLYIPWNFAQEMAANKRSLQAGDFCTPSITLATAQKYELQMVEYLKEQISSYFSEKLLAIVRDAAFHKRDSDKFQDDISTTSGLVQDRFKQAGDPVLEFIKQICAVLALDQNVQHDILVMRRNLLRYVRVKEFAPEAEFQDSCPSFILPNIICSYCNDCRDLDLSRDSSLLSQEWCCAVPQCGHPYPLDVIENALLQIVRQRERIYHLQDLVCSRCNQVKGAHLTEQCTCGGTFRCKEDALEFRARMQIFSTIALHQKFQLLQECTSWILEAPNFRWGTSFSTVRPPVENPTSGLR